MGPAFRATLSATFALFYLVSGVCADSLEKGIWPQWPGPQRDGRIAASEWPADLSEKHLSASWSVSHGPSYSGPIVAGDMVFVTETKDKRYEVIRASVGPPARRSGRRSGKVRSVFLFLPRPTVHGFERHPPLTASVSTSRGCGTFLSASTPRQARSCGKLTSWRPQTRPRPVSASYRHHWFSVNTFSFKQEAASRSWTKRRERLCGRRWRTAVACWEALSHRPSTRRLQARRSWSFKHALNSLASPRKTDQYCGPRRSLLFVA